MIWIALVSCLCTPVIFFALRSAARGRLDLNALKSDFNRSVEEKESEFVRRIRRKNWRRNLQKVFSSGLNAVETIGSLGSASIQPALAATRSQMDLISRVAQQEIVSAVESGKLASQVILEDGANIYLLILPEQHDRNQLIRRHGSFGKGWVMHMEMLRAIARRQTVTDALVSFVIFLNPDAEKGFVVLTYFDYKMAILPAKYAAEEDVDSKTAMTGLLTFELDMAE